MRCTCLAGFVLVLSAGWAAPAAAQDSDNDGLPDAVETELGTDKDFREPTVTLETFPAKSEDHPELDVVRVDFGNVAKDRWLWAIHFAKPYSFANSNLIIYLDSDNDPKTGRKGMGCEVQSIRGNRGDSARILWLSHDRGRPGVTAFAPDGTDASAPPPRVALANGVLYVCHDGPIQQDNDRTVFRFSVLSETRVPHASVRSTGWAQASGPPNSNRKKLVTWPAACTVEYGPTEAYGQKITEEAPVANHRLYLPGRPQGETWHYRIVAPRPNGTSIVSKDSFFTFWAPATRPGTAKRERTPLKVENPYDFSLTAFPINSGVPFGKGELGRAENVRLLDSSGKEVGLQPRVAARWQDGSIKWLHVSFLAAVEAKSAATYTLEYGAEVKRALAASPLGVRHDGDALTVDTGPLRVRFDAGKSGFPTGIGFDADGEAASGPPMLAEVRDSALRSYTTQCPPEHIEVEEAGPVRIVVKVAGHHSSKGETFFAYTNRFTFHAGSPFVRVQYTWGNDCEKADFSSFKSICLRVPLPKAPGWKWTVGLGNGKDAAGQGELSLRQLRDDSFEVTAAQQELRPPAGLKAERADGWIDLTNDRWGVTAAVRDFWQLYPRAFRVTPEGLAIALAEEFPDGTYDKCSKLDEIKLYYYLMGGQYKVRLGVQKQNDLMLFFHKGGFDARARQMAQAFQEPLIAACTPKRYCSTGVFGEILPATAGRSPDYEEVCEKVYRSYIRHRDGVREFGLLNFGDQWGERKVNWANGEYDHHHAFLMQFIRAADRKWYFLGERAARHAIDVDTCHYGPRRGGEWIHAMGHTGGYFKEQYEGNGIPGGGLSASHTWTEGFYDWFALSGDPTAASRNTTAKCPTRASPKRSSAEPDRPSRSSGWTRLTASATPPAPT